jgi:hypothetical protein
MWMFQVNQVTKEKKVSFTTSFQPAYKSQGTWQTPFHGLGLVFQIAIIIEKLRPA